MVLKKKEKVSKVVRRTKKPRTTYKRRNHKGLKSMEVEAAAVKSTTASLADCTEKVLQDLGGMLTEIKQAREINKHVIGRNVRTHQMLDLFLAILNAN